MNRQPSNPVTDTASPSISVMASAVLAVSQKVLTDYLAHLPADTPEHANDWHQLTKIHQEMETLLDQAWAAHHPDEQSRRAVFEGGWRLAAELASDM
jgi:hypothetical protein